MTMITSSVSALWVGSPLSPYEELCLSSFVRAGHEVRLFTYDSGIDVPDGVVRWDANEVLPQSRVFENRRERGTYAAFANIFRYRLLQIHDTTWVDADVLLLADTLPDGDFLFGYETPGYVNNGVLRAPRDSDFLSFLYDQATAADPADLVWGQIGPRLLTEAINRFGLHHLVQPIEALYPLCYTEVGMLFDPAQREAVQERVAGSFSLHLWSEIMRRGGPVKQLRPPRGSWLDQAFDSSGIEFGSRFEHDVSWVMDAVDLNNVRLETVIAERDALRAERDAAIAEAAQCSRPFSWFRGNAKRR